MKYFAQSMKAARRQNLLIRNHPLGNLFPRTQTCKKPLHFLGSRTGILHKKPGEIDDTIWLIKIRDKKSAGTIEEQCGEQPLDGFIYGEKEPGTSRICDGDWSPLSDLKL